MICQKSLHKRFLPFIIQYAEAHRKPSWLPVAKSKVFRVPKRPVIPGEEKIELLRLFNNYRTQMRAVRRFYYDEMIKEKSTLESATSEMSQRLEAEEWEQSMKINNEWNARVAADREERRRTELAALEEYAIARMEAKDQEMQEKIRKASDQIRKQKELSATFISPETLDEAIEHALANPINYNFAIDLQGNKYVGRDTPIEKPREQKQNTVSG